MNYPKIIAVDFDGTLCKNAYPEIGEANLDMITHVISEKLEGAKIILWTCRNGELLENAVDWCEGLGLEFDAVNENLPYIIDQFGGDTRKIFANEYIDDKNIVFEKCHELWCPYLERRFKYCPNCGSKLKNGMIFPKEGEQ